MIVCTYRHVRSCLSPLNKSEAASFWNFLHENGFFFVYVLLYLFLSFLSFLLIYLYFYLHIRPFTKSTARKWWMRTRWAEDHSLMYRVSGSQAHFLFSETRELVSSVLLYLLTLYSYLVTSSFFFMLWKTRFTITRLITVQAEYRSFLPYYLGIIPT